MLQAEASPHAKKEYINCCVCVFSQHPATMLLPPPPPTSAVCTAFRMAERCQFGVAVAVGRRRPRIPGVIVAYDLQQG